MTLDTILIMQQFPNRSIVRLESTNQENMYGV